MTDDEFEFTRRKVLGAVGATGAAGALSGAGTMALFNDREDITDNAVTAGKLDLKVDWTEHYNGEKVQRQDLTDDPGPIFTDDASKEDDTDGNGAVDGVLDDVKPGDSGEATISLHNYHNPAWVHMGGELTSWDGNGLEEPEEAVDDADGDDEGELADEILVDVWYDGTENDTDGGNNEFESDETPIACGTLRDVMYQLESGVLLEDQTETTSDGDGGSCNTSEEWKIDKTPSVGDTAGSSGEVEITGVYKEEGEVVGIDWESKVGICYVAVQGGPATTAESYNCATIGTDYSPKNTGNPNRTYYEISNVQFYYCENGGDGKECFPNSTTQYIGFSWELPKDVDNRVQGDSVAFDLKFHAQQCRHNDDPTNPFA